MWHWRIQTHVHLPLNRYPLTENRTVQVTEHSSQARYRLRTEAAQGGGSAARVYMCMLSYAQTTQYVAGGYIYIVSVI